MTCKSNQMQMPPFSKARISSVLWYMKCNIPPLGRFQLEHPPQQTQSSLRYGRDDCQVVERVESMATLHIQLE